MKTFVRRKVSGIATYCVTSVYFSMYGIEVVEVLSMSVLECVMIGYGDGRTHVLHHFNPEMI